MTLKDIVAKLSGLESRAEAQFKAEIDSIKSQVTGALATAQTDLATAQGEVAALKNDKEKLTTDLTTSQQTATASAGEVTIANGKLVAYLTSLKQVPKEGATLLQNVESATTALSATLAAQGIKIDQLPAAEANTPGTGKKTLSEQVNAITDPVEKSQFIQKNMAALEAEVRAANKK